ncbi:non-homologous end-joining DNA ligase [uncultured Leifsonia sp.]|uniref:non-homologous end-joining DNA ligase n=1 Tax=uncultured Leifsonia sp. TaxID=340359 RepID=UPI0025E9E01C|nr:non-homologous end-joining DNA ligase [uncultured Leifsonia sp.]
MPATPLVDVDGRRLRLTNLDKVLYPETGTTKGDVIHYYATIAPALLPHLAERPVTRKRWPDGVGSATAPIEAFFEKDLGMGVPNWVLRQTILHSGGEKRYPVVTDRATLVWLAQSAALELHVPQWRFDTDRRPTRMVLDFDPGEGTGLAECAQVALWAKAILDDMGLPTFPVTSGSKGVHVYVPLDGRLSSDQVSDVARELARALEADHPAEVISTMPKARRVGKVFIGWSQNNAKKTTISPYSLRGTARPFAAAPRTWEEIAAPGLEQLDFSEVLDRFEDAGDLLAALDHSPAVRPPEPLRGQIDLALAKASERVPEAAALPGGSRYEPKLDGWRTAAVVDVDRVTLWSRQKTNLTEAFPDVATAIAEQADAGVVLDGELVRWNDGRLEFDALQRRFASGKQRRRQLVDEEPIDFVVFDILAAGGRDLRGLPYDERRHALEQLAAGWRPPLSLIAATTDADEGRRWFEELTVRGIEGVVVKGGAQPYRGGQRDWIKVKHRDTFEVVAGAVTGTLTQPGELILGRFEGDELRIIGRTTPLRPTAARALTPLLRPAPADHPWPDVISSRTYDRFQPKRETKLTLIEPLTVEISADTSIVGGTIRHAARFVRARPEVSPDEVSWPRS